MRLRFSRLSWIAIVLALAGCAGTQPGTGPNTGPSTALSPTSRLKVAKIAEESGNSAAALNIYQTAAAAAPNDGATQIAYAHALLRAGNIVGARDVLLRAAARSPGDRALPREVAVIDTMSGNSPLAIGEFDHLLGSDPHDWKTMVDKAVALDIRGDYRAAQALYRQAMPLAQDAPSVATDYAVSLLLQGHFKAAQRLLAPFFNRYDAPGRTRNDLAIADTLAGDKTLAKELLSSGGEMAKIEAIAASLTARVAPAPPQGSS